MAIKLAGGARPKAAPVKQKRPRSRSIEAQLGTALEQVSAEDAAGTARGETVRMAVAVDPDLKQANRVRLRRIEGQVRGIAKMVEDERYCADIVVQVAAVQEALRGVARGLMRNHLQHCATKAFAGGAGEREAMYDELLGLIYKHLR